MPGDLLVFFSFCLKSNFAEEKNEKRKKEMLDLRKKRKKMEKIRDTLRYNSEINFLGYCNV
jgi:hypothetical protein